MYAPNFRTNHGRAQARIHSPPRTPVRRLSAPAAANAAAPASQNTIARDNQGNPLSMLNDFSDSSTGAMHAALQQHYNANPNAYSQINPNYNVPGQGGSPSIPPGAAQIGSVVNPRDIFTDQMTNRFRNINKAHADRMTMEAASKPFMGKGGSFDSGKAGLGLMRQALANQQSAETAAIPLADYIMNAQNQLAGKTLQQDEFLKYAQAFIDQDAIRQFSEYGGLGALAAFLGPIFGLAVR